MNKTILFSFFFSLFVTSLFGQGGPFGTWKTIDDATGVAKSHLEVYEQDGKLFGKITKLLDADEDALCEECKGDLHNKPVLGMVVINDMKPYNGYWKKGTIMDPENGNVYKCSIWLEQGKPDELKVRGIHWTGIYRTQTWYRVK